MIYPRIMPTATEQAWAEIDAQRRLWDEIVTRTILPQFEEAQRRALEFISRGLPAVMMVRLEGDTLRAEAIEPRLFMEDDRINESLRTS